MTLSNSFLQIELNTSYSYILRLASPGEDLFLIHDTMWDDTPSYNQVSKGGGLYQIEPKEVLYSYDTDVVDCDEKGNRLGYQSNISVLNRTISSIFH